MMIACITDKTKPWYSPSVNQRPKACSDPRELPRFFIIASNWLLQFGCSFVQRDWLSGSHETIVMLLMKNKQGSDQ